MKPPHLPMLVLPLAFTLGGDPAHGSPAMSDQPLPQGARNGDIVYADEDGLLWLVWANTKSRIWFPPGVTVESLQTHQARPDISGQIRGLTDPLAEVGTIVTGAGPEALQVFWIDTPGDRMYPIVPVQFEAEVTTRFLPHSVSSTSRAIPRREIISGMLILGSSPVRSRPRDNSP